MTYPFNLKYEIRIVNLHQILSSLTLMIGPYDY